MNRARSVTYKGIRFRSVLEAEWAYWMDQIGWFWEYEPEEFGGYIPDFWVKGRRGFFLEVKSARDMNKIEMHLEKIDSNLRLEDEILVVGLSWTLSYKPNYPFPWAGWLRQVFPKDGYMRYKWAWSQWITCGRCGSVGIVHQIGAYICYPCGCRLRDLRKPADFHKLDSAWNEAKSKFRWKPFLTRPLM